MLMDLVDSMKKWLKADPENVLVVHCNSGKGRAGTAVTSLLVYLGFYENVYSAAQLFSNSLSRSVMLSVHLLALQVHKHGISSRNFRFFSVSAAAVPGTSRLG